MRELNRNQSYNVHKEKTYALYANTLNKIIKIKFHQQLKTKKTIINKEKTPRKMEKETYIIDKNGICILVYVTNNQHNQNLVKTQLKPSQTQSKHS